MSSTADIVRQLLVDLGVGVDSTTADWSVFVNREPDTPDQAITVYDTAGITEGRLQVSGEVPEQHSFQVRVRSSHYPDGYDKIEAIATALDQTVYGNTITLTEEYGTGTQDFTIHAATKRGTVIPLGVDESNSSRYLFTVNYTITFD